MLRFSKFQNCSEKYNQRIKESYLKHHLNVCVRAYVRACVVCQQEIHQYQQSNANCFLKMDH